MPINSRATTTTNSHGRRAHFSVIQTEQIDGDYLRALKIIDKTHRQKKPVLKNSEVKNPHLARFSSGLSSIGQEAMLQSYEDTLISHLTDLYSSKRIGDALPRQQLTMDHSKNSCQCRLDAIRQAQLLLDTIHQDSADKDDLLCNYIKWHDSLNK